MKFIVAIAIALSTGLASVANAASLRVDFTPLSAGGVSGFVVWDLLNFDGSSNVRIFNTDIIDLDLNGGGATAGLADVSLAGSVFFDASGPLPVITEAAGLLTNAPSSFLIRTTSPTGGNVLFERLAGSQVLLGESTQTSSSVVPLPAAAPMLGGAIGLFVLMGWRRRRESSA